MAPENDHKGKRKAKYAWLLCGGDHFTKECPCRDEINKFLKSNPAPVVLTDHFPSQQQLIDHMSNHGNSNSSEEICMMSLDTNSVNSKSELWQTRRQERRQFFFRKSSLYWFSWILVYCSPNHWEAYSRHGFVSTQEYSYEVCFNPNAQAAQFYNVVEDIT